jgi:hypothetical protein
MSSAMKKYAVESELKKAQRIELEKWTKSVMDGVLEEQVRRSERRAIPAPILGQQNEVCNCFVFLSAEQLCLRYILHM